jgi:signal peptidase I
MRRYAAHLPSAKRWSRNPVGKPRERGCNTNLMRKKILIISLILIVVGAAGLFGCYLFFVRMVRVPTGAMANTIIPGDHLVVKKLSGDLKRGDVIVFSYPKQPSVKFVSRVVGLPGETIEVRDKLVFINGKELPERRMFVKSDFDVEMLEEVVAEGAGPYQVYYGFPREAFKLSPEMSFGVREPFQIPASQYFMMSDNRDNSLDSRFQGAVSLDLIWGKPTRIYWSESRERKVRWERIGTSVK